jgi:hypothetical protein
MTTSWEKRQPVHLLATNGGRSDYGTTVCKHYCTHDNLDASLNAPTVAAHPEGSRRIMPTSRCREWGALDFDEP